MMPVRLREQSSDWRMTKRCARDWEPLRDKQLLTDTRGDTTLPACLINIKFETVIKDQSIICFAGEDWWYHHPHSKNHIMKRLARAGNRVMFVNSISMGLPSLSSPDLV